MNVIYVRTSTEEQNPLNQLNDCKSINKWGEYELYEEQQSAFKDKERPIFENVKSLIKKGQVKHLIVWDWDRLYRNRKKLMGFFKLCKVYDCQIHSFRQGFFEDVHKFPEPFDEIMYEVMLQLMGWMSEDESKKKSERIKNAIRKDEKGNTVSYHGNKWGRRALSSYVIAQVVGLRKQGFSIRSIASEVHYWDGNGNKKQLSKSAVHKILSDYDKGKSIVNNVSDRELIDGQVEKVK